MNCPVESERMRPREILDPEHLHAALLDAWHVRSLPELGERLLLVLADDPVACPVGFLALTALQFVASEFCARSQGEGRSLTQ